MFCTRKTEAEIADVKSFWGSRSDVASQINMKGWLDINRELRLFPAVQTAEQSLVACDNLLLVVAGIAAPGAQNGKNNRGQTSRVGDCGA